MSRPRPLEAIAGDIESILPARRRSEPTIEGPKLRTLRELAADPEALKPPPAVADRLAWVGRSTLLSSREKSGKTTLLAAIVADVANGRPFLGRKTKKGAVLYIGLEEHPKDVVRRLLKFGALAEGSAEVYVGGSADLGSKPLEDLRAHVESTKPVLVVIDTLAAFAAAHDLDSGDSAGWQRVVQGLTDIAHDLEPALIAAHHQGKRTGEYRDSTAIGGAVDMIVEVYTAAEKRRLLATERRVEVKGRLGSDSFVINFEGDHYTLSGTDSDQDEAERPMPERIERFLLANPGATANEIAAGVAGRRTELLATLRALIGQQRVRTRSRGSRTLHYLPADLLALDDLSSDLPGRQPGEDPEEETE